MNHQVSGAQRLPAARAGGYTGTMESQQIIAATEAYFGRIPRPDIVAAYLFGSVAPGTHRPGSDVDIGLLYAVPPPATLAGLPGAMQAELESLLKRPVQLVVLNRASPDLLHRVLRDGKLVHESDKTARVRFEVHARQIFLDLLPLRNLYRGSNIRLTKGGA